MEVDFVKGAKHCALIDCQLRDFLPFACGLCEETFCLEHRKPAAHSCSVPVPDNTTVFCPICKNQIFVRYSDGENPQLNLALHAKSGCKDFTASFNPQFACQREPRCKKKSDTQFFCSICTKQFCLKHRAPDNHDCQGPPEKSMCCIM